MRVKTIYRAATVPPKGARDALWGWGNVRVRHTENRETCGDTQRY